MERQRPHLPQQLAIVELFRSLGIVVLLSVTRDEAVTLSVDDVAALRELGATDALLDELRRQAAHAPPAQTFDLDFAHQTVTAT